MKLYNIINRACIKNRNDLDLVGNIPSYIKVGNLPRVYLVSRNKENAQRWGDDLNSHMEGANFVVQELSLVGKLRFYFVRYFSASHLILRVVSDLDSGPEQVGSVLAWYNNIYPKRSKPLKNKPEA